MSLNQLTIDEYKEWLNIRVNNLQVDGSELGRFETGSIQWSGASISETSYQAEILGNVCVLKLSINNAPSSGNNSIVSTNFPASLVPVGSLAEGTCIVVSNSTRVLGSWQIRNSDSQLEINTINPANNELGSFSASGNSGWSRPIVIVYQLDQ